MTTGRHARLAVVVLLAVFASAMTASASAAAGHKSIKVGFVYISPIADGGWSYQQDLGRKYMDKKLGDRVSTFYVGNVPESGSERVIRQMAASGTDLIFTTSFGYMNPTLKVAQEFPNVIFMHCSGYKRRANMGTYMARLYQGRYLAGMVAGLMTKTDKLGFVATHPIPEVFRAIDGFTRARARSIRRPRFTCSGSTPGTTRKRHARQPIR